MAAINFNRKANELTEGVRYEFTANAGTGATNWELWRHGVAVTFHKVGDEDSETRATDIFRDGETVADLLACHFATPMHVESGNAPYKADILTVTAPIADGYSAQMLQGIGGYHSHAYQHRTDCSYYFGIELETVARNEYAYRAATHLKSNMVYMERDGSLPSYGIEYITTLIRPQDAIKADFWQPLCDTLTGLCKSATVRETGLHVHISRTAFGTDESAQIENIAKAVEMVTNVIPSGIQETIFGRSSGQWCKVHDFDEFSRALAIVKRTAPAVMKENSVKAAYMKDLTKYNKSGHGNRYFQVNLTNENTVEFRQGKGAINSNKIAQIVQFIDTLVKYCNATKFERLSMAGYIASVQSSGKYSALKTTLTRGEE